MSSQFCSIPDVHKIFTTTSSKINSIGPRTKPRIQTRIQLTGKIMTLTEENRDNGDQDT